MPEEYRWREGGVNKGKKGMQDHQRVTLLDYSAEESDPMSIVLAIAIEKRKR